MRSRERVTWFAVTTRRFGFVLRYLHPAETYINAREREIGICTCSADVRESSPRAAKPALSSLMSIRPSLLVSSWSKISVQSRSRSGSVSGTGSFSKHRARDHKHHQAPDLRGSAMCVRVCACACVRARCPCTTVRFGLLY